VSLWDQRGSRVIRGDLLVIPIAEALLYVQPVYLQAEGGTIPELKRVVVAFQNQVIMRETLESALSDMFGGNVGSRASADLAAAARLGTAGGPEAATAGMDAATRADIAEAQRRYQAALEAQRSGDWARYGEEIRQLGSVLERLNLKRPR
jgi:hypothetical protein